MKFEKNTYLAERLKFVRLYYNLSQSQLADLVGTTQQAIQQAEKGKARQPRYLHKMARALNIPINWLVFGEEAQVDDKILPQTSLSEEMMKLFNTLAEEEKACVIKLIKTKKTAIA